VLMREEAGVEDGRKGGKRKQVMTQRKSVEEDGEEHVAGDGTKQLGFPEVVKGRSFGSQKRISQFLSNPNQTTLNKK